MADADVSPVVLLADQAYYAIREMLVSLEIQPGSPLQEDQLCAQLGLGRTPVREAIKRLGTERLVVVHPRRGTFAAEINIADHVLLADVRRPLEGLAAQRAAERVTASELRALEELRERLEPARLGAGAVQARDLMRLDRDVHSTIYRCTRNGYLISTLSQYYNLAVRIWAYFLAEVELVGHLVGHRALVQAILDGNGEAARELAMAHVDDFETAVLNTELQRLGGLHRDASSGGPT